MRPLIVLCDSFPFSLLDSCKHIKNLSLSGSFDVKGTLLNDSPLPQLKSLVLYTQSCSTLLLAWLKLHINELQSLKVGFQSVGILSELLEVCSETLTKLEIDLEDSNDYTFRTGIISAVLFTDLSPVPRNLQQLTIRTAYSHGVAPLRNASWLLAVHRLIHLFISSTRHLVLDINLTLSSFSNLTYIDFFPLSGLGEASRSIPRIDLYVRTRVLLPALTRSQLVSALKGYEGIARALEEGVLVIHSEKTAPDCVKGDWASGSTTE